MIHRLLCALVLILLPLVATADQLRVFFFGHSLIHHLTDSDETTVPYWLAQFARAGGHDFAADGIWGFPGEFAAKLPPVPNWRIAGVTPVMGDQGFAAAGFDVVILSPPNFVQHAPPEALVFDAPMRDSIGQTLGWVARQGDAQLLLYDGWVIMPRGNFPPSDRVMRRWHEANLGPYHDWSRTLAAGLAHDLRREVGVIPVAPVLSSVLTEGALAGLGAADLFSDTAPHGTATTYLLAAMITYSALFNEAPPEIPLPATIHPRLRDNQAAVATEIGQRTASLMAD